jgi:hypothetical protein
MCFIHFNDSALLYAVPKGMKHIFPLLEPPVHAGSKDLSSILPLLEPLFMRV